LSVIDNALDAERWSEAHELLHSFRGLVTIPVKQRLLRICKAQGDDYAISGELKELAALHEKEGASETALQLYKEARGLNADDRATSEKINELEITLGIVKPALDMEFDAAEQITVINNSLEKDIPFEVDILTASGLEKEELTDDEVTASIQQMPFEINIMSDETDKEIHPAQGHQVMSADAFAAKIAEADFFLQQGLEDAAILIYEGLILDFPDNEEITAKLASLKTAGQQPDAVYNEIKGDGPLLRTAADDDLKALFAQYENPKENKVDYEGHYVAGLDFKQKGLLDEAIKELQKAAKDPDKFKRNLTMLALCYMEKKAYPLAIAEFTKILDSMTSDDSTYLLVKYELANAHMSNKEVNRALELYFEIHALDPDFKDVSAKMASLKGQKAASPGPEDMPRPKRDRVSYI